MKIIYLYPQGGFKTELRSDTLWGLICWAIRNIYGNEELENFIQSYNTDKPEFIISSTFPFLQENNVITEFFPRPLLPAKAFDLNNQKKDISENIREATARKKFKKLIYINKQTFEDIINGITDNDSLFEANKNKQIKSPKYLSQTITHNTIDRIKGGTLQKDNSGQLFHITELFFDNDDNSDSSRGLFFLVEGQTEKFEAALRLLTHFGYGGDRTTGKGFFKFIIRDFVLNQPKDFNALTNLSLYYPEQKTKELDLYKNKRLFNYQLENRQGYVSFLKYNKFDKYSTTMFKEGSVFPVVAASIKQIYGYNRIVKDKSENTPHNVFQYGIGFMIKMNIKY